MNFKTAWLWSEGESRTLAGLVRAYLGTCKYKNGFQGQQPDQMRIAAETDSLNLTKKFDKTLGI